jgi:hypothetical protein
MYVGLQMVKHENVLRWYGVVVSAAEPYGDVALVTDLAHGSLFTFLHGTSPMYAVAQYLP